MNIRTAFGSTGASGRPLLPGGARALATLALSAGSGIHLAQAMGHLTERSFHGRLHMALFLAAALFQAAAAGALFLGRLGRKSALATINMGLAAIWVMAVSIGLPDWLAPATPEPLSLAGAAAVALEIVAASALLVARAPSAGDHPTTKETATRVSPGLAAAGVALVAVGWTLPVSAQTHRHASQPHRSPADHRASADHGALHVEGVHLHGLGGDAPDPGPDPIRQTSGALSGTRLPVGLHPAALAVDGDVVWVADRDADLVHRLDARSGRSLGPPTPVGVHPSGIAVGAGAVWVTNAGSDTVSRLDPTTAQNLATFHVGRVPVGLAVDAGSVWVTNSAEGTVSRVDPTMRHVVTTPRIGYGPTAITLVAGRPWVVTSLDRAVVSLDPTTGAVLTDTPVDAGPASIAFGHGSLWVASSSAGTVTRINPLTGARIGAPIVVDPHAQPGQGPAALAIGSRVSVLNNHDKTVVHIDPSSLAVSQPQFIDRRVARHITPASLASSDSGELWATEHDRGLVVRLQP